MLLQQPELVLLDEADTALDAASAAAVRGLLIRHLPGCAVLQVASCRSRALVVFHGFKVEACALQVAHRLEHIQACQTALVMRHGRVAEVGPPQQLAADSASLFGAMLRAGAAPQTS